VKGATRWVIFSRRISVITLLLSDLGRPHLATLGNTCEEVVCLKWVIHAPIPRTPASPEIFGIPVHSPIQFDSDRPHSVWQHLSGGTCFNGVRHDLYPKKVGLHLLRIERTQRTTERTSWYCRSDGLNWYNM